MYRCGRGNPRSDKTASLLQAILPGVIRDSFDWTTLTLLAEHLQQSRSALLCQVEHIKTGQLVKMYLLFEH